MLENEVAVTHSSTRQNAKMQLVHMKRGIAETSRTRDDRPRRHFTHARYQRRQARLRRLRPVQSPVPSSVGSCRQVRCVSEYSISSPFANLSSHFCLVTKQSNSTLLCQRTSDSYPILLCVAQQTPLRLILLFHIQQSAFVAPRLPRAAAYLSSKDTRPTNGSISNN